jgi:hypothetical protein
VGQTAAFPIALGSPAGAGGVVLNLSSDNTADVTISPSSVYVPAGALAPAAQPQITGLSIGSARITASAAGYLSATRQVIVTSTITMSPTVMYISSGGAQLLAMTLTAAAPSNVPITGDRGRDGWVNGLEVQLSSSNPNVATLRPSVMFYPDGSQITSVVAVVSGLAPGTAVIHASAPPYIPDTTATVIVQ